ncbi:MAG: hypothetical protein E7B29_01145 [Mixta calida]|nr:hypothetical protein [Mixta calida]
MAGAGFDYTPLITQLAIGLATGSLAAFLTAKFALGRFYKEKWWEKRAIAFNELVNTVYKIKETYTKALSYEYESLTEFHDDNNSAPEEPQIDWKEIAKLEVELEKISDISALTLTVQVSEMLSNFNEIRKKAHREARAGDISSVDAYETIAKQSNQLLIDLIKHARNELKV